MLFDRRLMVVAGVAGSLLCSAAANAQTISVGLQSGGPIVTEASGLAASGILSLPSTTFGGFTASATALGFPATGLSNPLDLLSTQTIDIAAASGGTLNVFVTITGLPTLGLNADFTSGFAVNNGTGTFSVTEKTFYDLTNAAYGTGNPLSTSVAFTAVGSGQNTVSGVNIPSGFFSVTELYAITFTGGGNLNATIDVSALLNRGQLGVPLPAALPMFASVLGGGFLFRRLRKRRKANVQLAAA